MEKDALSTFNSGVGVGDGLTLGVGDVVLPGDPVGDGLTLGTGDGLLLGDGDDE